MRGEIAIAWANIRRNRLRNLLLVITIAIGFLIFGVLGTSNYSMSGGNDELAQNRLMVLSQTGLTQPLPLAYAKRLASIEGVASVSHATWFGLYYQDPKNDILTFAVDPASWIEQHHEMIVTQEAVDEFLATRDGMLVSHSIARKYGWQIGEVIPFQSVLFDSVNDSHWSLRLSGLFRTHEDAGGRNYIITHYDYLNENRGFWNDTVSTFLVKPADFSTADQLASRIDEFFGTSAIRTFTTTDKAFHVGFFEQLGDLFFLIKSVLLVSFSSILLVVGSTLALTIRQRTRSIAVLKVLGYSNAKILRVVYFETLGLVFVGGLIGIGLAGVVNEMLIGQFTIIPDINLPLTVLVQAAALMIGLGIISGFIPALLALRMKPVEAFAVDA